MLCCPTACAATLLACWLGDWGKVELPLIIVRRLTRTPFDLSVDVIIIYVGGLRLGEFPSEGLTDWDLQY